MRTPNLLAVVASLAVVCTAAPRSAIAQSQTVVVRATDFKFDAPVGAAAGTISFRLDNAGKEVHHLWLIQIRGGRTFADLVQAMDSWGTPKKPDWAVDVGGPNDVSAGMSATAILTLEPGRYAMVCYVPAADGRPHVMHGMMREFTVTGTATVANEPTPDVTIKLTDYAYDLSKPIEAGPRVIRVENTATQSHEVIVGQLRAGKTMAQALRWLNEGQKGVAPVVAMGGASGLAKGRHQTILVDFEPGRYVLLCFIPDAKDGKPHTAHGMAREFTVAPVVANKQ